MTILIPLLVASLRSSPSLLAAPRHVSPSPAAVPASIQPATSIPHITATEPPPAAAVHAAPPVPGCQAFPGFPPTFPPPRSWFHELIPSPTSQRWFSRSPPPPPPPSISVRGQPAPPPPPARGPRKRRTKQRRRRRRTTGRPQGEQARSHTRTRHGRRGRRRRKGHGAGVRQVEGKDFRYLELLLLCHDKQTPLTRRFAPRPLALCPPQNFGMGNPSPTLSSTLSLSSPPLSSTSPSLSANPPPDKINENISSFLGFTNPVPIPNSDPPPGSPKPTTQPSASPTTSNITKAVEAAHTKEAWKPKRVTSRQPCIISINPNHKDRNGAGYLSCQHKVEAFHER